MTFLHKATLGGQAIYKWPRQMTLMMFMYQISFFRPVPLEGVHLTFPFRAVLEEIEGCF